MMAYLLDIFLVLWPNGERIMCFLIFNLSLIFFIVYLLNLCHRIKRLLWSWHIDEIKWQLYFFFIVYCYLRLCFVPWFHTTVYRCKTFSQHTNEILWYCNIHFFIAYLRPKIMFTLCTLYRPLVFSIRWSTYRKY